jgi:hypothetical protein
MMGQDYSALPVSRTDARSRGLARFFTGESCIHGHIAPRYTSTTNCVECQVEHARSKGGWIARPSKEKRLQLVRRQVESRGGVLLSTKYVSAKSKLKARCEQGHEFEASADNLKRKKWCPKCKHAQHSKRMAAGFRSADELKTFARQRHAGDCLAEAPIGMLTRVAWRCANPAHKPFLATLAHVMHSGTWCPECDVQRRRLHPPKPRIPRVQVEAVVKERGGEIVRVHGEHGWKGLRTRLSVRCEYGHEWEVMADNLMHARSWCSYCRNKGERITRAIFEATFPGHKFPKIRPDWLALATGRKLELDGYSDTLRLAFEYQGYHHEKEDVKATDALKIEACRDHGIQLVEVMGMKRPFPPTNVLREVASAFRKYGIQHIPVMPVLDVFAPELRALRQLAQDRGGELVSAIYCGAEPHEWRCGVPGHVTWFAEPWRIKKGNWCPSCAGNRPLGLKGLREWGLSYGLALLNTEYQGSSAVYEWRCNQFGHLVRRSKGNIQQSLTKGLPACNICGPGITTNVLARKASADKFATQILPMIESLKGEGHTSLPALAKELNERGIPTARGAKWHASTVKNLLSRVKPRA